MGNARLVFVDWAGDPGFQFRRGSSAHLIVVAVFTSSYDEVRERLRAFRQQRRLPEGFPFHYAGAMRSLRLALGALLVELPFAARAVVVSKAELMDPWRQMRGDELINYFVAEAVLGAPQEWIDDALLVVDGSRRDTKQVVGLRVAISRLCGERGLACRLRRVKGRPAAEEDGLQVADAIAGIALGGVALSAGHGLVGLGRKVEVILVPAASAEK